MQVVGEFGSTDRFGDRVRARDGFTDVGEVLPSQGNLAGLDVPLFAHCLGGCLDGGKNGFIAAATANDVIHRFADLIQTGVRVVLQESVGGQQLSRRAKAALDGSMGDEGFLERVQRFEVFALVLLMLGAQGAQALDG